jgi:hypothetical protein
LLYGLCTDDCGHGSNALSYMERIGGIWTAPEVVPGGFHDDFWPAGLAQGPTVFVLCVRQDYVIQDAVIQIATP